MEVTFVASIEWGCLPAGINVHVFVTRTIGVCLLLASVALYLWEEVEKTYHEVFWPAVAGGGGHCAAGETGTWPCPGSSGRYKTSWAVVRLRAGGEQLVESVVDDVTDDQRASMKKLAGSQAM